MIWIVHAFSLVDKCIFIALWTDTKMTWAIIRLAVTKLWEFTVSWKKLKYICALRISRFFLSVKTENNDLIKEIKHVLRAFIALWKPRQSLWEFLRRWKHSTAPWGIDLLSNSSECSPRFSPGNEGTENKFYFLRPKTKQTKHSMKAKVFISFFQPLFLSTRV